MVSASCERPVSSGEAGMHVGDVHILPVTLCVAKEQARRLFVRLGFEEYGKERNSLKHDGRYYDEILMAMDLVSGSARGTERERPRGRFSTGENNLRGDNHDV